MNAEAGPSSHPSATGGSKPPKKRQKTADEVEAKKQKACYPCRRAKLRCEVLVDGEPCKRCTARGEDCRFKIPLHDDKWQESMTETLDFLVRAVGTISQHLNLPFDPPNLPRFLPSPKESNHVTLAQQPIHHPDSNLAHLASVASGTQLEASPNYLTQSGAETLLAHAYAQYSPPLASHAPSTSMLRGEAAREAGSSFFGLLEDLVSKPPLPMDDASDATMAEKLRGGRLGTDYLQQVGSQDPRLDVVKSGLVQGTDAEILVDFFHAHLANHLFGFPLQLRSWPYLPTGKPAITPLILGSICMISAERIPRYHEIAERLASSDLRDSILSATPGQSFAQGSDPSMLNGTEPDLDLELGIGPEEISALLIYATFSCSPRSDIIARTAFEWTRGYLKTWSLPSPPPVTYGEVFGLLPKRRDLTFEQWLRLWLFAFVTDAQQSFHHERACPIWDPNYFCDTLLLQTTSTPTEQLHDRSLVAHARLCSLLLRIQHIRLSPNWSLTTRDSLIEAYEQWNVDLDAWWADQQLDPTGELSIDMVLTMFRLFARTYVNLAASEERQLGQDPAQWRFKAVAVRAAWEMLKVAVEEPWASNLNLQLPFYVKMVSLSAMLLLSAFNHGIMLHLPCSPDKGIELVSRVADNFSRAPVPRSHACHAASSSLFKAIERMREVQPEAQQ